VNRAFEESTVALDHSLTAAIEQFWHARQSQITKQTEAGRADAGARGAVTGGKQMAALEQLVSDVFVDAGVDRIHIKTDTALELPGYYRPEKKWDLLVIPNDTLVAAIEFKSQVGPSFGNNFNNRTEEAIGSATDLWRAYREGRLGSAQQPFLGYCFSLEDCPKVHSTVRNAEPHFKVDPAFSNASYAQRYALLIRRLVLDRLYSSACLILASADSPGGYVEPADDLSFRRFAAAIRGAATTYNSGSSR
jgi:hypothetical protein